MSGYPVRVVVTDDLRRTRLTVFFRFLLALPHLIWLALWGIVSFVVAIANWFATLFAGQAPPGLHDFLARYLRYATHVNAYLYLLADPYPGFGGALGYPVDLELDSPAPQSRITVFFRIVLAIPALLIGRILNYLLQLLAFFGWFICLFTGQMPKGMRDLGIYCLRYDQQAQAYVLLLTERYPPISSPGV
jgi:Domain of unknown function (DUF4389)